jgi:flagellar hook assembly protein FlgD
VRSALAATLTLLLVWLALPAPAALAADPEPKVVVVVGPVGSSNRHYKDDANEIVAEARRHTSNVVKIFTPNATWSRVKAAMQGASVFVYLGHGNGWPSIYAPFQTVTKNGLGLDPSSGADGVKTVYYGEDYIRRDIRLAPNAVVLLYHLCYASGNTEPGLAVGSFADSRERVDNYGAGFIGAGARAVIAEGHPAHPVVNYVRQLFTTNRSMEAVFRNAPTFKGNVLGPYPAERTPGLRYLMDPDSSAPSGFYRSIIGDLSLTASKVVRSGLARTDAVPADFVVAGGAEVVAADGAGLWARAEGAANPDAVPPSTLAAGTRLRLTAEAGPMPDGTRIFEAKVLGGSDTGFVRATAVAPRDSEGVAVWSLDESPAWLSPNGDGVSDELVVAARLSESAAATLVVRDAAGAKVRTLSATSDITRFAWNLRASAGSRVPDGAYTWTFKAADAWGNPSVSRSGSFTVDGTPPVTKASATGTEGANGWLVSPASVVLSAKDALSGVRSISWRVNGGKASTYSGPANVTANGTVAFEYRATDKAGIREAWRKLTLRIDTRAPSVALDLAGKAGDVAGTWRGPVTITPTIRDAASGVASKRVVVDGGDSAPLGGDPIVVSGNGHHTVIVTATDEAGNRQRVTETFTIDTVEPAVELGVPGDHVSLVTPNGDGRDERATLPFTVSEAGTVTAAIDGEDGGRVRTLRIPVTGGSEELVWDGRTDTGIPAPDGAYTVTLTPRDAAGNVGGPAAARVDVYGALAALRRSPSQFFPQDADRLARRATATWTLVSPAAVTIRVLAEDGSVVRTGPTARQDPAGAGSWSWNGRDDAGAWVPRGRYRIEVGVTNGAQSASQAVTVQADAFRLSASVATALRGRSLVLTAVTAEPLAAAPRLTVRQPGLSASSVTMTKTGKTTWTATVTPRRTGDAGTLRLVVKATDTGGGTNSSTLRLPLQ